MDGGGGVHWTCERMLRRDNIRKPKINVFSYEIHVQFFFFFFSLKRIIMTKAGKISCKVVKENERQIARELRK